MDADLALDGVGLAGFVEAAEANGWELKPTIAAAAVPSAHVTNDAFERVMKEMIVHAFQQAYDREMERLKEARRA